jgi:SAM-dependent methyltransferase
VDSASAAPGSGIRSGDRLRFSRRLRPGAARRRFQAIGIDPGAPEGPDYRRTTFEQYRPSRPAEAVVACTSLHHVTDLDTTLDGISKALAPDGVLVVVEWAWERLDEPTLQWCFARLARDPEEPSWLHTQRDECRAAGQPWAAFQQQWADQEHMHLSETILRRLADHFEPSLQRRGPYLFHDLDNTPEADEQAAIDTGLIQATRADFVGVRP